MRCVFRMTSTAGLNVFVNRSELSSQNYILSIKSEYSDLGVILLLKNGREETYIVKILNDACVGVVKVTFSSIR